MLRYFLTRLLRIIPVLLIVTMFVTVLLELIPGDPAEAALGEFATPESLTALRHQMGLDESMPVRYVKWLGHAVRGDLGTSMEKGSFDTVASVIKDRLPVSLEIALLAFLLAVVIAMITATAAAARVGTRFDRAVIATTSAVQSMPSFCYAIIGVVVFAVHRRWFPVSGWTRLSENPLENLKSVALPAMSLGLVEAAAFTRILRTDLVTTLNEDFVMSARAKGLTNGRVVFRHALRPSSFGLVTLAGVTLARLVGGTVVIESLFGIPGLGQRLVLAITRRDYVMVQGLAAFLAVMYVVMSIAVEIVYALLDPRVRARMGARA